MRKRFLAWLPMPLFTLILAACSASEAEFDVAEHAAEVMEWRAWRIEQLKKPSGYLNQTGLFWLKPGTYGFGSAADNALLFSGQAAPRIGEFLVTETGVSMHVAEDIEVAVNGEQVFETALISDAEGDADSVTHGSLGWSIVERVGRFAVRLRDFEHPFVANFGPLPYYEIEPELKVTARLIPYAEPRTANVGTVIEGLGYHPQSPGVVEFELGGETYELEAYAVADQLFYVFGDRTNRDETYGAGRFLYSAVPGEDGLTVLDFNKSYSPPCAFNDFSTCPVASPRNRLPIRIEAGEKYDPGLHFSATH